MELNNKDLKVLDLKANNPNDTIYCTRCGKEIVLDVINSTIVVHCIDNCIKYTERGI